MAGLLALTSVNPFLRVGRCGMAVGWLGTGRGSLAQGSVCKGAGNPYRTAVVRMQTISVFKGPSTPPRLQGIRSRMPEALATSGVMSKQEGAF